jgi:hypothetical protein
MDIELLYKIHCIPPKTVRLGYKFDETGAAYPIKNKEFFRHLCEKSKYRRVIFFDKDVDFWGRSINTESRG